MWYGNTMGYYSVLKKKETLHILYNMDEPQGHDAKWNKTVTKRQIFYDSTSTRYPE